jgi:hypothetical protein
VPRRAHRGGIVLEDHPAAVPGQVVV